MTPALEPHAALRRWLLLAVFTLLGIGIWSATSSHAATHAVDARDFAFQPAEMTVAVGDTVTWTNRDAEAHAVQGGPMSSPDIPPGGSFSQTFTEVGDVSYLCRLHTYMTGVVHVTNGGGGPTTTTTAAPTTTTAAPTTSTTAPGSTTTSTTAPGSSSTTSSTTPDGSTTSTSSTSTPPTTSPPSGGRPFQRVPDDPSGSYPPGHPSANDPPPATAEPEPATTTTTRSTPREFQDVPPDPGGSSAAFTAASVPSAAALAGLQAADEDSPGTPLGDGTVLAPYETARDGTKVFHLTMDEATIEVSPGVLKSAYAFNGIVPGPVLRVNEGDRIRLVVENQLPFATAVHWHGMILPNSQDGVPGITQPPVEPGDTFTYEWDAVATGTHWYHSHSSGRHIGKGLYGALEVVPTVGDIAADRDYRVLVGDTDLGFILNGKSYPGTPTLAAAVGETVRLRVINTGDQVHAMHLHGTPFKVAAQDGIARLAPEGMDTLTVSPGQTFDLVATMPSAGQWLFHCHIFAHSHLATDDAHTSGDHSGMTGMVMVINVVDDASSLPALPELPLEQARAADLVPVSWSGTPSAGLGQLAVLALVIAVLGTSVVRRRSLPTSQRKEPR